MKKQLIIFIISFLLAVAGTTLIFGQDQNFFEKQDKTENADIEKSCREVRVNGCSMEPTLVENDLICAYIESPQVGDLVVFKCKNCGLEDNAIKRLKKIENGCYWVEGDNLEHSFDSRNFGYLCANDLEYIWKAKKDELL